MSQIVEIKNINSFRFVEKALTKAEEKLRDEYSSWPSKPTKETWGYNSETDSIYLQRTKEEAADYRYFPEPDLPPIRSAEFDLDKLKNSAKETHEEKIKKLGELGVSVQFASVVISDRKKMALFDRCHKLVGDKYVNEIAKAIVQNTFVDLKDYNDELIVILFHNIANYPRNVLAKIVEAVQNGATLEQAKQAVESGSGHSLESIVDNVLADNPAEVARYKNGEEKLFGFFVGAVMRETKGSADPQLVNTILKEKL